MSRIATVTRTTLETDVRVTLDLDGDGTAAVATGVGFFDHLLSSLAHHALFSLTVEAGGDLEVDDHHTVEDVALTLGQALGQALGDRTAINRFGDAAVPMDEARAQAVVDVGGRAHAVVEVPFRGERIGTFTTQNFAHAVESLAGAAAITVHLTATGANDHHVAEAAVKSLARALRAAVAPDDRRRGVASTKGTV